MLAGIVLVLFGKELFWCTWPAIAFLVFMIPLPYRVETGLSLPLQRLATLGSTYVLQTLGRPAFAEGNVIVINEARIGVVEACNGLGMFLAFFAIATGVVLLVHRPIWEKTIVFASAVPIAVFANVARISMSSLLHELVDSRWVDSVAHDMAGWLMMPLAIVALWLVLVALSKFFVKCEPTSRINGVPKINRMIDLTASR